MHIMSWGQEITGTRNATVRLDSGDSVSVAYKTPDGRDEIITITAQHLVLLATHERTDASIIVRPGGVATVDG